MVVSSSAMPSKAQAAQLAISDRAGEGGRRPHLVARVHNKGFTTINKGDSNGEGSDNADNLGDKAK